MAAPLMPKATAVWLIENTALSFDQIAEFCELHTLEVQAIADEEVAVGIVGMDPIANGQLTKEEIARCEQDPSARLQMAEAKTPRPSPKTKGPRYTPIAMRQERPDAIAWLLRHYPELSDAQISKLVGTTKTTINAVRDRTHWKGANIKPVDPVDIGICSYEELLAAVQLARKRQARAEARAAKDAAKREREPAGTGAEAPFGKPDEAASGDAPLNPYEDHLPMGRPGPEPPAGGTAPATPPEGTPESPETGPEETDSDAFRSGTEESPHPPDQSVPDQGDNGDEVSAEDDDDGGPRHR